MSLGDYPKAVRRELRELEGLAHERDLAAALAELAGRFDDWRRGRLDPFELNQLIHEFHHGASREIWKRYDGREPVSSVAYGLSRGLLKDEEVSAPVRAIVRPRLEAAPEWLDELDEEDPVEPTD